MPGETESHEDISRCSLTVERIELEGVSMPTDLAVLLPWPSMVTDDLTRVNTFDITE